MRILLSCAILLSFQPLNAQHSLEDFIQLAKSTSFHSSNAEITYKLAKLEQSRFGLLAKPTLSFNGNIPAYNKDNYAVTQPDGTIKFLPRSQNYSNLGFSFSQPLLFSGGSISVNTDLYRFDNFTVNTKQYNSTPVFIRLSQPLFKYNAYKWDRQIAPLKLQEADLSYKLAALQTEYDVCRLYFAVIAAQEDVRLAASNFANTNTNLGIEKRRVQLGASTEDKVMGLEMLQINSRQQQAIALLNIGKAFSELYSYINVTDTSRKTLQLPETFLPSIPDRKTIVENAKQNLPQYIAFHRKRKEAEARVAEARMQGRQLDLSASYGLNNTAADLSGIYSNPQNQQRFSIGFNIPLADWGKRKNNLAVAKAQQEQTEIIIKEEESKLLLEILSLSDELPVLRENINQSLTLDTLAQKRFVFTNRLFQSGKASLLELQAAQNEKDSARRGYIAALQKFWESWYLLKIRVAGSF